MYQIQLLTTAINELQDAFEWYEEQSEGLGYDFLDEVDLYMFIVSKNPFQFAIQFF